MSNHGPSYGLDAELEAKRKAKYDPARENEARQFIAAAAGVSLSGDFHAELKNGVVLCQMMNKIKPGACKSQKSNAPFVMMENINSYLNGCKALGLAVHDLFMTVDLYEAKNMNAVVDNVLAVKRMAESKGIRVGGGSAGGASPSPARASPAASSPSSTRAPAASSAPTSTGAKFCGNCGTKATGGRFCANCGSQL